MIVLNKDTPDQFPKGLSAVWTNSPKIITSSIYNNSIVFSKFLNTKVIKKVNDIFLISMEKFIISFTSINNFVSTRITEIRESFSKLFFEAPKADVRAIYSKAQGQTEEVLRILPNFKKVNILSKADSQAALENIFDADNSKCNTLRRTQSLPNVYMPFYAIDDVDQIFETDAEHDKLTLPLSPRAAENPINSARIKKFSAEQNSAKELQESKSFLKELKVSTLNELPKSTILQEVFQKAQVKDQVRNARLKKFDRKLAPLTPLTIYHQDALKQDLDNCRINWLEKSFARVSKLATLNLVELANMIQETKVLLENLSKEKQLGSESKILITKFQLNLNKLEDLFTDKRVITIGETKVDKITTLYNNYLKSHKDFLRKAVNHKMTKIESYVQKQSPKLTNCLAEIEFNLN